MNQIAWYPSVQEGTAWYSGSKIGNGVFFIPTTGNTPSIRTCYKVSMLGNRWQFFNTGVGPPTFQPLPSQCEFLDVNLSSIGEDQTGGSCSHPANVTLMNNLWERSTVGIFNGCVVFSSGGPPSFFQNPSYFSAYNNTFWQCTSSLTYQSSSAACNPAWAIAVDNLFDGGRSPSAATAATPATSAPRTTHMISPCRAS